MKKIALSVVVFLICKTGMAFEPNDTAKIKILFLGNSITYAGNYVTDIEAYLVTHHLDQQYEIINAGLPSETVSGLSEEGHAGGQFPRPDLHERLDRVLALVHPDIVYACYGMNDGIYLPLDVDRFQKFKDGINWLHDKIIAKGAKMIHVTPPIYDELKGKKIGYAHTLDTYANWIISRKVSSGWEVVDLHGPMKEYLNAHRNIDTQFHILGFALAEDGVHPNEAGHWIMAKSILLYMKEKEVESFPDIRTAVSVIPNGEKILQLISEKQHLMKDAWLTATQHTRPGMKNGLPLSEAKAKSKVLDEQINQLIR